MRIIQLIVIAGAALFSIACSKGGGDTPDPGEENNGQTLKVMSYNIRIANPPSQPAGTVDMEAIANVIKAESPDIVALQEVDKFTTRSGPELDQAKKLAELTGMQYYFAKAIDRSNGEYGVAILSKKPILQSARYSLPIVQGSGAELRAAGMVEIEWEQGKKLYFVSTHLDHLTNGNRELQARELLKALQPYAEHPIIIGGDFNMPPSNDVWNVIKSRFKLLCTTCPATFSAVNPTSTIDYIIMNDAAKDIFSVKSYRTVLERYASDHLPLVAELSY